MLVPRPAYFNGSDQQSAAPDSPTTPHMYRLGTYRELSEPPGTTARSSSSRQNRRDGALVIKPINRQKLTLNDKYKAYLAQGVQPKGRFNNSQNLFDDSNRKDKKWLKITRDYLKIKKAAALLLEK